MKTREELKVKIEECVSLYQELTTLLIELQGLLGLSHESRLLTCMGHILDNYIGSVEALLDVKTEWLRWYIYDNDCGSQGFSFSMSGENFHPVTNIDELLDAVIQKSPS